MELWKHPPISLFKTALQKKKSKKQHLKVLLTENNEIKVSFLLDSISVSGVFRSFESERLFLHQRIESRALIPRKRSTGTTSGADIREMYFLWFLLKVAFTYFWYHIVRRAYNEGVLFFDRRLIKRFCLRIWNSV